MELNEHFAGELLLPIKVVWLVVRHDLPPEMVQKTTNQQLIELCIDFDRLKKFGYEKAARMVHRAVDIHGYQPVRDFLAREIQIA